MTKKLLVVESPTKEKTIRKFLGADFSVISSYGHIRDLPAHTLGIDLQNNYEPQYVWIPKAKNNVARLKQLVQSASQIFLATDFDREGEAIAWHIVEGLKVSENKVRRITFHEITKDAIAAAIKTPRAIDISLVNAQQARRVLDRLVGYKLSPLLWSKIQSGLSAGRVQSVALRIIVERDGERARFSSEDYWSVVAVLKKSGGAEFSAALIKIKGEKIEREQKYDLFAGPYKVKKTVLSDEPGTVGLIEKIKKEKFVVQKIEKKSQKRSPSPPYTTSTLQQDAARRLGFSAKKTMQVAQSLYEGVGIGGGETVGLITYMRTDSFNIAAAAQNEARSYIKTQYGDDYLPQKPWYYKTKSKGAQEAHEAIRPTSIKRTPDSIKEYLENAQFKLYELIWCRFAASQMSAAVFDTAAVEIVAGEYLFRANGRLMRFDGFLRVYEFDDEKNTQLPPLEEGDHLELQGLKHEKHSTTPPPQYNEASLIRTLEEYGIGRPSTYASIIATIIQRKYAKIDEKRFSPTKIGITVNDFLKKYFVNIVDLNFTAQAEKDLDAIAEGKSEWRNVIDGFYKELLKNIANAGAMKTLKEKPVMTDELCPKCKSNLVVRSGKFGKFTACSGFPKCRYIKPDGEKKALEMNNLGEKCPKCGKDLLLKTGRFGKFIACSGFPKCRFTRKVAAVSNEPEANTPVNE